jgi:hypothetical protein
MCGHCLNYDVVRANAILFEQRGALHIRAATDAKHSTIAIKIAPINQGNGVLMHRAREPHSEETRWSNNTIIEERRFHRCHGASSIP